MIGWTALRAVATVLAHPFLALKREGEINPLTPPLVDVGPMPRAIVGAGVRADVSDPKAMFEQLNKAWESFKETHASEVKEIKAGMADVVTSDKLAKINDTLSNLQEALDDQARELQAAKLNGGKAAPRDPEYTSEFSAYFKGGTSSQKLDEVKAAVTKTDGEGGFLAPIEWDRTIAGRLKQVSMVRQYASVISISSAGFSKVFNNRAFGSGWVGEQAARPETSTPAFASLTFPLGELYANPAATQGLIDDAEVDIEAWLADEVSTEFARQEGIAFLSGDGVNKPHGILTYVTGAANAARHPWGAIQITKSGNNTAVTADTILDLIYSLPEEYEANAMMFLNRATAGAVRKLKDGQNNYLWQPSMQIGQPSSLAGAPVVHLPAMPTIAANAIAALYGDMAETYQVVDRIGVRVLRDPYTNKPFVLFYTTKRVGGGVKNPDAMKAYQTAV
ncbi:phage major capsid protein [Sphingomonas sp. SFZ2018-12]|uniref:phage major capsid protein n=1 Tax=Sphingomonas sp. SFZ2018-12 TaxID=2683197 RepID=UPI001F118F5E|nr:phage major capsid protein [Sphingomonas sp. SFZ2018-12]MCH4893999.1 phage major capsid protein [Sphingomonas sp. SFZ2018-12]